MNEVNMHSPFRGLSPIYLGDIFSMRDMFGHTSYYILTLLDPHTIGFVNLEYGSILTKYNTTIEALYVDGERKDLRDDLKEILRWGSPWDYVGRCRIGLERIK